MPGGAGWEVCVAKPQAGERCAWPGDHRRLGACHERTPDALKGLIGVRFRP